MKATDQDESTSRLRLLSEYLKDLSFESPRAHKFGEISENPALEVGIDIDLAPKGEHLHEVVLSVEIHARSESTIIYHVELSYGGLFWVGEMSPELRQQLLSGHCPQLLFASLRRVVADITYFGGFTPLMLDFGKLPGFSLRQF